MKSTITILSAIITIGAFTSCKPKETKQIEETKQTVTVKEENLYNTNNPIGMLTEVSKSLGGLQKLKKLNDVSFTYNYISPDGKKDISTEKYIFEKEVSWAKYTTHQINVSPDKEGTIIQFYDGKNTNVYLNSDKVEDQQMIGTATFLRQANYMWFTMMHKLTDPGTLHQYLEQETIKGVVYDKIKITYDPKSTGKEVNDIYIVYINPKSKIVERFLFSLPAFKVEQPVLLAKLNYTEIDGVKVIDKREMFSPTSDGNYTPMVTQTLENIKFNNGYTKDSLAKLLQ